MIQVTPLKALPADQIDWKIKDRFSDVAAVKINDPLGQHTGWSMVYGRDKDGSFKPVRTVSARYEPIPTQTIVDIAKERLGGQIDESAIRFRTDRFGTSVSVTLPFKDHHQISKARPYDANTNATVHGIKVASDLWAPSLTIRNGYAGITKVFAALGWFRLICTNGAVLGTGIKAKAIHTVNEIARVIETLADADWSGDEQLLDRLPKTHLSEEEIKTFIMMLPKRYHDEYREHIQLGGRTAYAAFNYLSYLQSHVYSLNRSTQLDKPIAHVLRLVA